MFKRPLLTCITLLVCVLTICGQEKARSDKTVAPDANQAVAFVNVNVIPMDRERVLPNQTVMVRGRWLTEDELRKMLDEIAPRFQKAFEK